MDGLSILPRPWYSLTGCPGNAPSAAVPGPPASGTPPSGPPTGDTTPVVNPHADSRLLNRFRRSGHATITAMTAGHTVIYPKHGGNPICMSWALKGSCLASCRRKSQHVRYGAAGGIALGKLMDDCGVAATPSA